MMVSVNAEDLALVVGLACLTESRDNDEQKAMLAVAERCDKVRNTKRSTNVHPANGAMWAPVPEGQREGTQPDGWLYRIRPESRLEIEADATRRLWEKGERRIKPSWERKPKR
jgi:hypothetical protein